jgi:hypothetical protein
MLKRLFDTDELYQLFINRFVYMSIEDSAPLQRKIADVQEDIKYYLDKLESIYERLDLYPETLPVEMPVKAPDPPDPKEQVEHVARRFHVVARQLRQRHANRPTLDISDEYDVQDLLHVLLKVFFNDVRPEENTPSYAGGAARMDFLLKAERAVVEVKKTRPGLKDREVGNQLIEDIGRYREHPDCKTLICFVYDPDGYISNPDGLEGDLSRMHDGMAVRVIIAPKGH